MFPVISFSGALEKVLNFYPFHIGDYAAHTAHLSPIEDIAYRRLLDLCYLTEKPLMHDVERLSRLVRLSDHVEAVRVVLDEFFQATDDGWISTRVLHEIAAYEDKRQKAKASARASVAARSTNAQRTLNGRSTGVELPEPLPEPEPISNTHPTGVCAPAEAEAPDCPHRQVLELWKSILPSMPQHDPELWSGTRSVNLRTRWREVAKAKGWTNTQQGLAWFERLFRYIALSAFLTGRASVGDKRPFLIELEWLVKHANWVKVREGKYHQPDEVPHD